MTRLFTDKPQNHLSAPLPAATRERWQPIRGGLLNVYLYDYEEFRYEQGHLILRGNNGTGKSRVMALQLPFLFDGRLSSGRVEPDADPSKRMEWNLLMGSHNERLGYTWIEFGRLVPDGNNGTIMDHLPSSLSTSFSNNGQNGDDQHRAPAPQFVTLGCGLSATKGNGMRDPWFFITDQRIGKELFLQSEAGHPLSKSGLAEALGDRGTVYVTGKEYRQAVDEKLFGLGRQRYEAMVDLLIQLRKPQLSRDLDEKMLARVLAEALPPPSEQMITDVAESFRGLENDRTEVERFRSACHGVDNFLKTYRRYAQIASRRRAADVRQSHNRFESANRELRLAEREKVEASDQLVKISAAVQDLEVKDETLAARISALHADPKMRSANAIREAAENEQQTLSDRQDAQRESNEKFELLQLRRGAQREALEQAEKRLRSTVDLLQRAVKLAADCNLKSQHATAFSTLKLQLAKGDGSPPSDPRAVRRQVEDITVRQVKSSERLKKCNELLADAERNLAHAKKERNEAGCLVDQAIESQRSAEERRRGAVDEFLESYRMWRRDSDEMILPSEDEIAADVDTWSERPDEISPVERAVRKAEREAQQSLIDEGARLECRADALATEQSEAQLLVDKLQHGFQESPQLPFRADESARTARPGAPFWSLIDFAESCPKDNRANIEAALEAAGFLNAWVMPDGSVLTSDFADVLLTAGEEPDVAACQSLLEVLNPDDVRDGPGSGVSNDVITRVLRRIGYGVQNSSTCVSADGRWRNGPLHGHCRKDSAQYIGHDAREEQRLRHLVQAQAELERIVEQTKQIGQQRQWIRDRTTAITKQAEALPTDSEIRAASASMAVAMQILVGRRKALTEIERVVSDRQAKADGERDIRDRDARDLGLSDWVDRLGQLAQNIADYRQLLAEIWPSIDHFESLKSRYGSSIAAEQDAERDVKVCQDKSHEKQIRHAKAKERLKTLQETIGVEAAECQRQLTESEGIRRALQADLKQARRNETKAASDLARIEERIKSRQDTVNAESEVRQLACLSFQRLCGLGLHKTATAGLHDDDPVGWSVSRTVEIARQAESTFSQLNADDSAWDRIQQAVTTTNQELNTALSQQAFTSTLSTVDGLYCVTVPYQGRARSIQELRDLLSEEVEQRQRILDEREREIIENHLIGEVAAKLHEQIHEAHALVGRMNEEIQKRPMSTGMMLKFDWKPDDDLSHGMVEMCKKLLAAIGTWSPGERSAIGRCLQDHIKDVRASREMGTWHEHLAEALDYRRWHRFWVMRKQDTGWKRLTKRTHGTGSGGEKAVALTIPQFAAAAAHYSSARDDAPRLILLDEAFAGIDPDMRGKCMELINVFDLDFMLTSEVEWGCYAVLPGVAIHQVSRRSGIDAVFLTRWIWNGKQRIRDERSLPPAVPYDN